MSVSEHLLLGNIQWCNLWETLFLKGVHGITFNAPWVISPKAFVLPDTKLYLFKQAIQMQMPVRRAQALRFSGLTSQQYCFVRHFDKARSKESEEQAFKTSNNGSSLQSACNWLITWMNKELILYTVVMKHRCAHTHSDTQIYTHYGAHLGSGDDMKKVCFAIYSKPGELKCIVKFILAPFNYELSHFHLFAKSLPRCHLSFNFLLTGPYRILSAVSFSHHLPLLSLLFHSLLMDSSHHVCASYRQ